MSIDHRFCTEKRWDCCCCPECDRERFALRAALEAERERVNHDRRRILRHCRQVREIGERWMERCDVAEAEVARLLQRIDLDSQQWLRVMEATGDQEATVVRLREAGNRLQRVMSKACPTIADRRAAIAAWDAALQQSVPTTNSAGSSSRLVDAPDPRSADADRFLPGPVLEGLAQAEPDAPEAMGALTPIPDHGPSGTIRRDEGSRMDADEAADALAHLPMMRRAVERGRVDEGADDGLPFIRTIIDDRKPVALCACGHPVGWRPTHDGRSPGPLPANQRKCSRCACTGLTMPEPRVEQARESEA